jgi:hypothetical protein
MLHIKEYTVFIKHISIVFFENTIQHLSDRLQPLQKGSADGTRFTNASAPRVEHKERLSLRLFPHDEPMQPTWHLQKLMQREHVEMSAYALNFIHPISAKLIMRDPIIQTLFSLPMCGRLGRTYLHYSRHHRPSSTGPTS